MEYRVKATNIEKSYGGKRVLGPVSLTVGAGELLAVRGPNGAGKSTLLAILAGVLRPDQGAVELSPEARGAVGYVPQELSLYESLTAAENLRFWGIAAGMPGGAVKARTGWLLGQLGLEEKAGSPVLALSGGMKRRLHLASALMTTPGLLVLDEPTVGADPESAELILKLLRHMCALGTPVVMATHEARDMRFSDRVLALDGGLIAGEVYQ